MRRSSGMLIQSNFGPSDHGNFELVVPWPDGGFAHWWRNHDDPAMPWVGPNVIGDASLLSLCLIESSYRLDGDDSHGDFEVVGYSDRYLKYWWRQNTPPYAWTETEWSLGYDSKDRNGPGLIQLPSFKDTSSDAALHPWANGAMLLLRTLESGRLIISMRYANIQSELLGEWVTVPFEDAGVHYVFPQAAGVAFLDSTIGSKPNYDEYAVVTGTDRVIAVCNAEQLIVFIPPPNGAYTFPLTPDAYDPVVALGSGARGRPGLIQSDYGYTDPVIGVAHHGNLQLIAPAVQGGIHSLWYDVGGDAGPRFRGGWTYGEVFGSAHYDEVSIMQSDFKKHGDNGGLEVVAWQRGQRGFDFFFKNDGGEDWQGPNTVGLPPRDRNIRSGGSVLQRRPWPDRDFEAVVPLNGELLAITYDNSRSHKWSVTGRPKLPLVRGGSFDPDKKHPYAPVWTGLLQADFGGAPDTYGIGPSGDLKAFVAAKIPLSHTSPYLELFVATRSDNGWDTCTHMLLGREPVLDVIGAFGLIQESGQPFARFHLIVPLARGLTHMVLEDPKESHSWRVSAILENLHGVIEEPSGPQPRDFTADSAQIVQCRSGLADMIVVAHVMLASHPVSADVVQYTRNHYRWSSPKLIRVLGSPLGPTASPLTLLQDTGTGGEFHLVLVERGELTHFIGKEEGGEIAWARKSVLTLLVEQSREVKVDGSGSRKRVTVTSLSITQSDFGPQAGNLELLVGHSSHLLGHGTEYSQYYFDGVWHGPTTVQIV